MMKWEAESVKDKSESLFKHVFRLNSNYFSLILIPNWPIINRKYNRSIFKINCHKNSTSYTFHKATCKDSQALESSFEQLDVGEKRFYVTLDKNYKKISVIFGTGLKLIDRIRLKII